jgi:long-chain acyl-CoA synthetase
VTAAGISGPAPGPGAAPRSSAPDGRSLAAIDQLLARAAPDRAAIAVPGGPAISYRALDHHATRFAARLRALGAVPGDHVALGNANTPEFFAALFGIARAGLTAVPIDAGLAAGELANVLGHIQPRAVVVDPRSARAFAPLGFPLVELGDDLRQALPVASPAPEPPPRAERDPGPLAPALVLTTSGTTGTPRAAVHSHAGILAKLAAIARWFDLGEADSALCMLPTHFGHGLVCSCLTTLSYGGTLVLCRPFDLELLPRVFELADDHGVTTFSTVPTIVRLLLRNPSIAPPRTGRLRYVTCASAPLRDDEVAAFEARFGVPLLNCYGLTEAGTWSAMSPNTASRDRRSIGVATGCEIRAVGDDGAALAPGEIGELQIAGPSIMLGYRADPAATAAALRDGWLATGDLGSVDAAGRVYLAGRRKDLIIRAGANVYPADVERALLGHPAVAEAYVVGLDHPVLGEQVCACVVRRTGSELSQRELIQFSRGVLASYKCPERIAFVDAVPTTSRGKLDRAALRALFAPASA